MVHLPDAPHSPPYKRPKTSKTVKKRAAPKSSHPPKRSARLHAAIKPSFQKSSGQTFDLSSGSSEIDNDGENQSPTSSLHLLRDEPLESYSVEPLATQFVLPFGFHQRAIKQEKSYHTKLYQGSGSNVPF
ncbi:uncharacterized protein LOC119981344 [Tripterygium wilfordii]|uniref:uncharacterized protein LOC119981344 n=1 Tax=Tripterygium wilfordii TaxID=458696 RepID=UPI0018F81F25|nr:uncharacterized protein LOC119981344 [Tripterygium wilfordii]